MAEAGEITPKGALPDVQRAISLLLRAAKQVAQYPADHPVLRDVADNVCQVIQQGIAIAGPLDMTVTVEGLKIGDDMAPEAFEDARRLALLLRKRDVYGVTLTASITPGVVNSLLFFLSDLADEDPELKSKVLQLTEQDGLRVTLVDYSVAAAGRETDAIPAAEVGEQEEEPLQAGAELIGRLLAASGEVSSEEIVNLLDGLSDSDEAVQWFLQQVMEFDFGVEGEGGGGTGDGTGDGTGEGDGEVPDSYEIPSAVIAHAGASDDAVGRRVAMLLQRMQESLDRQGEHQWLAVQPTVAKVIGRMQPLLRFGIYTARLGGSDVALADVANHLAAEELAETLVPTADALMRATSLSVERALRRLAPDPIRRHLLRSMARTRLREMDVPETLFANVVDMLDILDAPKGQTAPAVQVQQELHLLDAVPEGAPEEVKDLLQAMKPETLRCSATLALIEALDEQETQKDYESAARQIAEGLADLEGQGLVLGLAELHHAIHAHLQPADGTPEWRTKSAAQLVQAMRARNFRLDADALADLPEEDRFGVLRLAGPASARDMAELFIHTKSPDLRRTAAEELAQLDETSKTMLVDAFAGLDVNVIAPLIRLLHDAGDAGALRYLQPAINNQNWLVRMAAVRELGTYTGDYAARILLNAIDDPDQDIRLQALQALGRTGSKLAVRPLADAAASGPEDMRPIAVSSLGNLGLPECVGPLIALLEQTRWFRPEKLDPVRIAAAEALVGSPGQEVNRALRRGASDRRSAVAEACRQVLERRQAAGLA